MASIDNKKQEKRAREADVLPAAKRAKTTANEQQLFLSNTIFLTLKDFKCAFPEYEDDEDDLTHLALHTSSTGEEKFYEVIVCTLRKDPAVTFQPLDVFAHAATKKESVQRFRRMHERCLPKSRPIWTVTEIAASYPTDPDQTNSNKWDLEQEQGIPSVRLSDDKKAIYGGGYYRAVFYDVELAKYGIDVSDWYTEDGMITQLYGLPLGELIRCDEPIPEFINCISAYDTTCILFAADGSVYVTDIEEVRNDFVSRMKVIEKKNVHYEVSPFHPVRKTDSKIKICN